ncbi:hypothetical protein B0H17DRAFT_1136017 [Mycena rosella]|uniref:3-beta hydroxysteroid dehydrogenase/isomerase domain-containing protein n=1 Tax=Mycena rosella TaxID=1033263 RepID=A0AAD7DBW2_MYCRO|nr:hypothetical protein B0H17DRAFT_1136017 [Mycena rosella]
MGLVEHSSRRNCGHRDPSGLRRSDSRYLDSTARGAKADHLNSSYASYGNLKRFETVKITDISQDQFPKALVDVDAIIHTASPLPGRAEPAVLLETAVEGTLNVMAQAEKAGLDSNHDEPKGQLHQSRRASPKLSGLDGFVKWHPDWKLNPVTQEIALAGDNQMEWVDRHPHVEVITRARFSSSRSQPHRAQPFTPHFHLPAPDFGALSTNALFYNLLFSGGVFPTFSTFYTIDVRDAAHWQAHVRALNARSTVEVGRKRIVLSSPYGWPFRQIIDFIAAQRPALKDRLITATVPVAQSINVLPMDFGRVEQVLEMKVADLHTTEQTMLDTVDTLLEAEDRCRSMAHAIRKPAIL